jgi:nitrile hydratase beta subunit
VPVDGVHDMGGMHGFGPAVWPGSEKPYQEDWERRVFGLHLVIGEQGLGAGPNGRATREEMEPAHYLAASYYERWLWSAERRLLRKGAIREGEVDAMLERLRAGEHPPARRDPAAAERVVAALRKPGRLPLPASARFAPGDRVRVRRMRPRGHSRCPRYVRGVAGVVERVQCEDRLPELATYGLPCEPEPVYSVSFSSRDVWGESEEPPFTILIDLWESYLEAA